MSWTCTIDNDNSWKFKIQVERASYSFPKDLWLKVTTQWAWGKSKLLVLEPKLNNVLFKANSFIKGEKLYILRHIIQVNLSFFFRRLFSLNSLSLFSALLANPFSWEFEKYFVVFSRQIFFVLEFNKGSPVRSWVWVKYLYRPFS